MQTFLPYPDFRQSAKCLDRQRLGKQRVECLQILRTLDSKVKVGWGNHPAVKMWRGFSSALAHYGLIVCEEWISRGYNDSCWAKIAKYKKRNVLMPPWIGNKDFHKSHQSNLIRKLPDHYLPMFPKVPPYLPYIWPIA